MNGLNRLQQYIKEQELTGVILVSPTNLHYFAGFTGSTGFAVITAEKAFMITDFRYTEQAQTQCEGYEVIQYETTVMDSLVDICNDNHIHEGLFGIEGKYMPVDTYETLCDTLDERFNFTSTNFAKLRAVKREDELDLLRKAARIGDDAFSALLPQLKVGMTENEARIILEMEMLKRGSEEPSFATIVASGKRSSMPHGVASDKVIEIGDFVTFDFGGVYKGYHSDMTRTIVMGAASDEQKKLYSIVLEAQKRGVAAVRAGITGKELDSVCRDYIRDKGYTREFNHGTGHGVGLDIHEEPVANPKSDTVFEENMIITVEPGIYISGSIGLRIEDSVIVKSDGYEVLTHSPKELIEIGI
ncbi:M24 family metallopeptidase [Veillonella denticariosi]|uniref:M24 family metallopeptidase n=1 Tax=Veillonella denticariosi TaxID=419208 RepID=UPI002493C8B9|nr:Xaa-Pro peptidase family protein [Veillonella denticariosi]